ncbi:Asp23/Gls24 family envelope stress response protein [Fusibacter paucivorans]|jgi:uncharacterized alkaline shock family protein YloU|uniref:Asp23/Gls24 family envelope stress response protein n=2 Tax=Fusibacter paucivorans TaxID=76009 RepID=A0ABS5PNS9_9FIRM|nr:Asp23/Gls24 family envelope stress response protein [Fusibacter paucivorans]
MINAYHNGKVNIADDVIGVITTIAASEIKGIKALSGTFQDDVLEMIGKKNFNKGIEVEMIEQQVTVNISIIVDYGFKVQEIAKQVQESVKLAIESMTGLEVVAVNVSVEGINTKMNA